jgi:hypothetical protein
MRIYRDKRNYQVMLFERGLAEMVKAAQLAHDHKGGGLAHPITRPDFVEGSKPVLPKGYFQCWGDVQEAIATPWQHGIEVIREMMKQLRKVKLPVPQSIRRKPVYTLDGGDEIDYDRLRSGQDYWRSCRREVSRGPAQMTIFTDITTSAYVSSDEILWRGAAALALTEVLEKQGYRCELWAFQHCHERAYVDNAGIFGAVRLKELGKPLNLTALACGISGWFYRSVFFQSYYLAENNCPTLSLGGVAKGLAKWQRLLITPEESPIIITGVWSFEAAVEQASQWLEKVILGKKHEYLEAQLANWDQRWEIGPTVSQSGGYSGSYSSHRRRGRYRW